MPPLRPGARGGASWLQAVGESGLVELQRAGPQKVHCPTAEPRGACQGPSRGRLPTRHAPRASLGLASGLRMGVAKPGGTAGQRCSCEPVSCWCCWRCQAKAKQCPTPQVRRAPRTQQSHSGANRADTRCDACDRLDAEALSRKSRVVAAMCRPEAAPPNREPSCAQAMPRRAGLASARGAKGIGAPSRAGSSWAAVGVYVKSVASCT